MAASDDEGSARIPVRTPSSVAVLGWRGDDAELLRRVHTNPRGGAALLHDRFASEVNRLVWRILGADAEHDDLVQQVFCQLLDKIKHVREPEKLRGWVQSITVNAVYSELRKRNVRRIFRRRESQQEEHYRDLNQDVESRDLLARLYTMLDGLPAAERIAFSLRFIEERPIREVAQLCGCSTATVKRRLRRAQERLLSQAQRTPELRARLARRVSQTDEEDLSQHGESSE